MFDVNSSVVSVCVAPRPPMPCSFSLPHSPDIFHSTKCSSRRTEPRPFHQWNDPPPYILWVARDRNPTQSSGGKRRNAGRGRGGAGFQGNWTRSCYWRDWGDHCSSSSPLLSLLVSCFQVSFSVWWELFCRSEVCSLWSKRKGATVTEFE